MVTLDEGILLADCVAEWIDHNVSHPFWLEQQSDFMMLVDQFHITSPPEQLFACVWIHHRQTRLRVSLEPQYAIGPYRVDFLICPFGHFCGGYFSDEQVRTFMRELPQYVIEMDGFEWHDKTPQQAERDKKRDRYIQHKGYQVLRFAAREVLRSPETCVNEVADRVRQDLSTIYARLTLREKHAEPRSQRIESKKPELTTAE